MTKFLWQNINSRKYELKTNLCSNGLLLLYFETGTFHCKVKKVLGWV